MGPVPDWARKNSCCPTSFDVSGACWELHACVGCRSELFSYERCIFYTVVTSLATLDRVDLKSKVVDAPEILTVIDSIPHLSPFLNALYSCDYRTFFKVRRFTLLAEARPSLMHLLLSRKTLSSKSLHSLQAFADISDSLKADCFLQPHFRYYIREVRVVAYSQVS